MKKSMILCFLVIITFSAVWGQGKYFTKTGKIAFYSHTPLEDIKADNNQVSSILDTENGDLVFAVLMKSFSFEKALMEEHFNENYVESEKFPKSTFQGKITNLSSVVFNKSGSYNAEVSGSLTIHGKSQEISVPATLIVSDGVIKGHCVFQINAEDYDIKIPKVVRENIAEKIEITIDISYEPYKQ